jgi:catechol 2,3-dioxygenase-like lactoylglutathione lyase family enzyme
MVRLDHLSLPVADWRKARDWYKQHLGFEVEFEIPDRQTAAMRDDADLTVFLYEAEVAPARGSPSRSRSMMSKRNTGS